MRKQPRCPLLFSEPFRFGSQARRTVNRRPCGEGLERRDLLSAVPSASILYNPPGTQESLTQTYPTDVFNKSKGAETYHLSVVPVGAVTFDEPSGVIPAGSTYSPVTITPKADSTSVNGTHIYVSYNGSTPQPLLNLTIVSITYGMTPGSVSAHIRNTDTPAGMPDRIPPRIGTQLYVNITPNLGNSGQTVTLGFGTQSPNTGTVTINGKNNVVLTGSSIVALSGSTQTAPGYAGRLTFGVYLTGPDGAQAGFNSSGFSVSAIPVDFSLSGVTPITGSLFGFNVGMSWVSDSGNYADLNDAYIVEQASVDTKNTNKIFTGFVPGTQKTPGSAMNHATDTHAVFARYLASPGGTLTVDQVYTFSDQRTGSQFYAFANAGFVITHVVTLDPKTGKWQITTKEVGQSTTANGFTSKAGTIDTAVGYISVTQE